MLNAVVRYLCDKYAEKFPEYLDDIAELKRSTYVDDILAFGKTDEEAHKRMTLAIDALEAGQMDVRKFRSHPSSIADELCKKDRFWKEGEKTPETFKVLESGTTHRKMRYGQPLSICMTSIRSRI